MSAPPHDTWPQVGDTFTHWSDLLLATQLAALRAGFTGLSKMWKADQPNILTIRCLITSTSVRSTHCEMSLIRATPVDPTDLSGAWRVDLVRTENLDVRQHSNHITGVGTTRGFKTAPSKRSKLDAGRRVKSWRAMHRLEASLRISARSEGRFLQTFSRINSEGNYSQFFTCVLGEKCTFYIRLSPEEQIDGAGWSCDKLCLQHSCSSIAPDVGRKLKSLFEFWPALKVEGEFSAPTDRRFWKDDELGDLTVTEQHLDDYPVLAPGQTIARHVLPPPDPILSTQLDSRHKKLSKALEALAAICRSIRNLQTKISLSDILDDTSDAVTLKKEMAELESAKSKIEKKVAKRKNKVRRQKLRVRYQQMLDKKVKKGKEKKAKKEKK